MLPRRGQLVVRANTHNLGPFHELCDTVSIHTWMLLVHNLNLVQTQGGAYFLPSSLNGNISHLDTISSSVAVGVPSLFSNLLFCRYHQIIQSSIFFPPLRQTFFPEAGFSSFPVTEAIFPFSGKCGIDDTDDCATLT